MKLKKLQMVVAVMLMVLLQACTATSIFEAPLVNGEGVEIVTERMSNEVYLALDADGKQAYLNGLTARAEIDVKERAEFQAGFKVCDEGNSNRCAKYDSLLGTIQITTESDTGAMGIESQGDLLIRAERQADGSIGIFYYADQFGNVKPVTFLANVATQEGWGRFLGKILGNALAGAANGVGAGLVNRLVDCDGCDSGGSGVLNVNNVKGGSAYSGSSAASKSGTNVDVDVSGKSNPW